MFYKVEYQKKAHQEVEKIFRVLFPEQGLAVREEQIRLCHEMLDTLLEPLQYNTVQNRVMDIIQKKDLRDDNGELFGFGTHMFRHVYGIRLTEMHLDDWTIAKLLGHTSVKNVKFYRKMSLQIIADETREIRAEMSRMIRANLAGWGKEYEQI